LIEQLVGPGITVINTGGAVARHLQRRLGECGLLNGATTPATVRFFSSGHVEAQGILISRLWGEAVEVAALQEGATLEPA
jgi:glutamate racemase